MAKKRHILAIGNGLKHATGCPCLIRPDLVGAGPCNCLASAEPIETAVQSTPGGLSTDGPGFIQSPHAGDVPDMSTSLDCVPGSGGAPAPAVSESAFERHKQTYEKAQVAARAAFFTSDVAGTLDQIETFHAEGHDIRIFMTAVAAGCVKRVRELDAL